MFSLYQLDRTHGAYRFAATLGGSNSLWGQSGALARLAGCSNATQSDCCRWCVTEAQLVSDLAPRIISCPEMSPSDYAILDDLVPKPRRNNHLMSPFT